MALGNSLPRSRPEEQGVSSSAILAFLDAVEQQAAGNKGQELHSLMVVRHGHVVAEGWWAPYRPDLRHALFSLSKSFTATAVGLAVAEGLLSVGDRVVSFFPDDLPPELSANLDSMRVRHLLSMSTGHAQDVMDYLHGDAEGNWVKGFLSAPVEHEPGSHFTYDTAATYMLSAVVQKVTGSTLMEYLGPRLFSPLGIDGTTWQSCPRGINVGGYGLSTTTEDIAKLGQLYLQRGLWAGERILPETWVDEATASHVSNGDAADSDWAQGYGYQFWRCRHGVYRGDGAFGQYCIVMPQCDAVVAITSGVANMQAVLNLVWEHLLPALSSDGPEDAGGVEDELLLRLSGLALAPHGVSPLSPVAMQVSGRTYDLDDDVGGASRSRVSFAFGETECTIALTAQGVEHVARCGMGAWVDGETSLPGQPTRVSLRGRWTDDTTFELTVRMVETPFCQTQVFRFEGDTLLIETSTNVSFSSGAVTVVRGVVSKGPVD